MALTYQNQLDLMKEILQSHYYEKTGHKSEYEQLVRSAGSLLNCPECRGIAPLIKSIKGYGEDGSQNCDQADQYINSRESDLSIWLSELH